MNQEIETYGTPSISVSQHCARTLSLLAEATDHNAILACLNRLMMALSLRRTLDHPNPARMRRDEPIPHLQIRDKVAGTWIPPRFLPLTEALMILVNCCEKLFEFAALLPYSCNGTALSFEQLPSTERKRLNVLLADNDQYNSGRTALYQSMLKRGAGEVICQMVMAHGAVMSHLYGEHLPVPVPYALTIAKRYVGAICHEEGIDQCAIELVSKLSCGLDRDVLEWARKNPIQGRVTDTTKKLVVVPRGVYRPMEFEEYSLYRSFFRDLTQFDFGGQK